MATPNPYNAPRSDAAGDRPDDVPPPESIARKTSFTLAALGLVVFWLPVIWLVSRDGGDTADETVVSLGLLLAVTLHLVGFGVVFAAPRGRRWAPALLNLVPLAIITVITVIGLVATRMRT